MYILSDILVIYEQQTIKSWLSLKYGDQLRMMPETYKLWTHQAYLDELMCQL